MLPGSSSGMFGRSTPVFAGEALAAGAFSEYESSPPAVADAGVFEVFQISYFYKTVGVNEIIQ